MSIFQLGAVLFGLSMLYLVSIQRKKARLSDMEVSFWYTTWGLFIVIALFPILLIDIANLFHFSRVFDLLVVVALMVLSVVVLVSYFAYKEQSGKFEDLVRKIAIHEKIKSD